MINQLVARSLPLAPKWLVRKVAMRYIAGETVADAAKTVADLNGLGAVATIDVLGEFVTSREQAIHETATARTVLDAITGHGLKSGLSVKLTSLGMDIEDEFLYNNLRSILEQARSIGCFVRLDMENSPYHDRTFAIYRRMRDEGFENLGIVLQAYMRRCEQDIKDLADLKPSVRLCKGIYRESSEIAYQGREEVRDNYKRLLRQLFDAGSYVGIATHDDDLIEDARDLLAERQELHGHCEFQMLYGVRNELRNKLLDTEHRLRIYVPFGADWYGYSVRRLRENPQIAGHVLRALFTKQ